MPADASQAFGPITESATFSQAAVLDTVAGTPRTSDVMRILVSAIPVGGQCIFTLSKSTDSTTFVAFGQQVVASAAGEFFIPFVTEQEYIGINGTISGSAGNTVFTGGLVSGYP